MQKVSDVFKAETKTPAHLFFSGTIGYYIPPYQREYSWKDSSIKELLEDVTRGFYSLRRNPEAITFLGSIIVIEDVNKKTIEPVYRGHLPSRVLLLIDGQQRLSTISVISAALHYEIHSRGSTLIDSLDDSMLKKELTQLWTRVSADLFNCFSFDYYGGDKNGRYPRIIRAYVDKWSYDPDSLQYESPLAKFLKSYIDHLFENKHNRFQIQGDKDSRISGAAVVTRRFISNFIKDRLNIDDIHVCSKKEITNARFFQESLFDGYFPDSILEELVDESKDSDGLYELCNLIAFARFFMTRVAVTEVLASDEDYAFDVFESLNTTGEPLSSFETFKPKVIRDEGLTKYEKSNSFTSIKLIESYINSNPKEKQNATNALLIPFALSEDGEKLSKKINDQRRYLKQSYEKAKEIKSSGLIGSRAYLQRMSILAQFLSESWPSSVDNSTVKIDTYFKQNKFLTTSEWDEVSFLLKLLNDTGHTITVAPLFTFYQRIILNPSESQAYKDFVAALRAIAAFYLFYRAIHEGTAKIDGWYRLIMSGKEGVHSGFAHSLSNGLISVERLKLFLQHALSEALPGKQLDKSTWVRIASTTKWYDNLPERLITFALLCAYNNSTQDSTSQDLVRQGKEGLLPLLKFENICGELFSIEHIAPQSKPDASYDELLYQDNKVIHQIGNLSFLPGPLNASIGNRTWPEKKRLYQALAACSKEEVVRILADWNISDTRVSNSTIELFANAKSYPWFGSLAISQERWTMNHQTRRGENLCQMIWDNLIEWLH